MKYLLPLFFLLAFLLFSCSSQVERVNPVSHKDEIEHNIMELKKSAKTGDLIVRMTDDLISEQIKFLNEKEKVYSHAGLVVVKNNEVKVYHIAPNEPGKDYIQFVPMDSFINPAKNLKCALYRYDLSGEEKDSLIAALARFKADSIHFDRAYDLKTDKRMYCAELIDKALRRATRDRIQIEETHIPLKMQPMVLAFFKNQNATEKTVAERKIITIDNLYLREDCSLVMKFPLKYLPQ